MWVFVIIVSLMIIFGLTRGWVLLIAENRGENIECTLLAGLRSVFSLTFFSLNDFLKSFSLNLYNSFGANINDFEHTSVRLLDSDVNDIEEDEDVELQFAVIRQCDYICSSQTAISIIWAAQRRIRDVKERAIIYIY